MDPTYHQRSRGMGAPLRPSKRSDRPRRPRFRRGCVVYRRGDAPSASIRGAVGSAFRLRPFAPFGVFFHHFEQQELGDGGRLLVCN